MALGPFGLPQTLLVEAIGRRLTEGKQSVGGAGCCEWQWKPHPIGRQVRVIDDTRGGCVCGKSLGEVQFSS